MLLYKHGSIQGGLPLSVVKKQIESYQTAPVEIKCIQALILKYKNSHNCVLQKSKNHYPSPAKSLASPLTHFLHQQFGLEFKFFIGNNHDKPYGFAIIDHAHKTIYKGGEVISLKELIRASDNKKLNIPNVDENQRIKEKGLEKEELIKYSEGTRSIVNSFSHIIQNLEYQVEQDLRLSENKHKGKKKKEKWLKR